MSTLTREHIEQALPSIKPGKILDLSDAHLIRETMRIALASLEPAKCGHVDLDCDDGKAVCLHCGKTWEV